MTWQCYMVDPPKPHEEGWTWPHIGAMWFGRMPEGSGPNETHWGDELAPEYFRDHFPARAPIIVMLPCKSTNGELGAFPFCVDSRQTDGDRHGWTVTGEPPNITVHPSINAVGAYHGWLQNGVISDGVQ